MNDLPGFTTPKPSPFNITIHGIHCNPLTKNIFSTSDVQYINIQADQAGQRIDNFLVKTLKGLPRSRLYRIIRKGEVRINKKRVKPEYKLREGDYVRIPPIRLNDGNCTKPVISKSLLNRLETSILFENSDLVVVDKPSGLAVHSGTGLRYGVIDVMRELRPEAPIELVHRIDRDTSGCLLLAKSRPCLLSFQRLLQSNEIRKNYIAIVKGHWDQSRVSIQLPLLRQTMTNGERKVYVDERGQEADTRIERVHHYCRQGVNFSLLKIQIMTGRTHQIRVHCQAQKHEIVGDTKYGDKKFNRCMKNLGAKRLMLHAVELEIPDNAHTNGLIIKSPIPQEINGLLQDE